jgi:hypothetical protein
MMNDDKSGAADSTIPTRFDTITTRMVRSMLAAEPVSPIATAIGEDADGRPLYLIAVVLGGDNIGRFADYIRAFQSRPVRSTEYSAHEQPNPANVPGDSGHADAHGDRNADDAGVQSADHVDHRQADADRT